jgi:coatomer protein complex subunit alpha (xenin)
MTLPAGDFDSAMKLLNRQLGIVNFVPLKQYFIDAALASHVALNGVNQVGPCMLSR